MFEIYTKEVEIKGEKYKLRPLNGRFVSKVFDIVNAINKIKIDKDLSDEDKAKQTFEAFDEQTVNKLHSITFETLKKSYPDKDENLLDEFTSQNLLVFMDSILEINMPNDK